MWATRIPRQAILHFFGWFNDHQLMSLYSFRHQVLRILTQMYITLMRHRHMNTRMAIPTLTPTPTLTRPSINSYTAIVRLTLPRTYADHLHSHLTAQE